MFLLQDKRSVSRAGEALHALHRPHGPRWSRGQEWYRRVPVPVQEPPVELHHSEGHHRVWPGPLNTWVILSATIGELQTGIVLFWRTDKEIINRQARPVTEQWAVSIVISVYLSPLNTQPSLSSCLSSINPMISAPLTCSQLVWTGQFGITSRQLRVKFPISHW